MVPVGSSNFYEKDNKMIPGHHPFQFPEGSSFVVFLLSQME